MLRPRTSLGYRSVGKKLEIVPEEAALVSKIFGDYLRARLDRCTGCLARKGKCQPQTSNARQRDNHRDPAIHGRIDQTV
jgi:hypothetical protein